MPPSSLHTSHFSHTSHSSSPAFAPPPALPLYRPPSPPPQPPPQQQPSHHHQQPPSQPQHHSTTPHFVSNIANARTNHMLSQLFASHSQFSLPTIGSNQHHAAPSGNGNGEIMPHQPQQPPPPSTVAAPERSPHAYYPYLHECVRAEYLKLREYAAASISSPLPRGL